MAGIGALVTSLGLGLAVMLPVSGGLGLVVAVLIVVGLGIGIYSTPSMVAFGLASIILFLGEFGLNQPLVASLCKKYSNKGDILAQYTLLKGILLVAGWLGVVGFIFWQDYTPGLKNLVMARYKASRPRKDSAGRAARPARALPAPAASPARYRPSPW